MRNILLTGLAVFMAASTGAAAQNTVRLERLNTMFEGNLSGAAFVKHCDQKPITDYPLYIENAQSTMLSLAQEMMGMGGVTPAQIEQVLRKKQSDMEAALNDFYIKNGCQTSQATAAQKHFNMFNTMPAPDMVAFLGDIENR